MEGDYVGDLMQLLQIMVEKGLANALERRCGGGDHCCRFQNISFVCSVFCGLSLFGCLFVSNSFRSDCLLFLVLPVQLPVCKCVALAKIVTLLLRSTDVHDAII